MRKIDIDQDKSSKREASLREDFFKLFNERAIPDDEVLNNLGMFISRQSLSRIIFMHNMYRNILEINGVVIEFGVRWGQNLALFQNFRGMYEPYNHTRKIIGFDSFEGFPTVTKEDGDSVLARTGSYSVTAGYEKSLEEILNYHEQESPIPHLKKFEIIKGDASQTFSKYLKKHPETIVALAYFDFDVYEPTRRCLELLKGHLCKGSIVGFDELNFQQFPGETLAFNEILGIRNHRIIRSPITPLPSYIVVD